MYDRQTDSLWAQILGQAIEGPMKGTKLEYLPSLHTTWEDWKTRYPETLALVKGFSRGESVYSSYFESERAGVLGETYQDNRLYIKEFVIGVENHRDSAAYPFRKLSEQPIVNDLLGDLPILVVFDKDNASGVVFLRQDPGGGALTFQGSDHSRLKDNETGSEWDGLSGEAISGPLKGYSLQRIKSTVAFWFAWKDWFPQTRVYGVEE